MSDPFEYVWTFCYFSQALNALAKADPSRLMDESQRDEQEGMDVPLKGETKSADPTFTSSFKAWEGKKVFEKFPPGLFRRVARCRRGCIFS